MRLIDADKLELKHYVQGGNAIIGYAGTIPLYHYVDVIKEDINNAPTVEAIPIEWIKKRMEHWAEYGDQYITITEMLEDWRTEND